MDFLVRVYEGGTKYQASGSVDHSVEYHGVSSFDVVSDPMAVAEIEATGIEDAYHEYLVLHMENGETATFCNSQVDLFRI